MVKKMYPLQEVLDEFGPPQGDGPISQAEAERYRGRIPDAMIEFWLNHGRGSWHNGLIWLCDPEQLRPVMETLFKNDPEIRPGEVIPYLRDAFGYIRAWHPRLKLVSIATNLAQVSNTDITVQVIDGERPFDDDMAVAGPVYSSLAHEWGWGNVVDGTPVFDAVLARLGPIREGQVYVMTPHFLLGGDGVAEDFSIGGLVEYLGFLIQTQPFTRTRYISPDEGGRKPFGQLEPVRTIGHDRLIE